MTATWSRRLTRYAVVAAVHAVFVLGWSVIGSPHSVAAGVLWVALTIPTIFAWLTYMTAVALNEEFDAQDRWRWWTSLFVAPYLVLLYWQRHVRGRRYFE